MGILHYGIRNFAVQDRLLAHLQLVIALKLRRRENFFLSWVSEPDAGSGRYVLWIDNGIPLFCEYETGQIPTINREWIETLSASAGTDYGLQVTSEGGVEPLPPMQEINVEVHDDVG